jgi:hypothetical protein
MSKELVVERYSGDPSPLGMRYAELLAARLKQLGYDATAVPTGAQLADQLVVTGTVAEIDGGNAAKRMLFGMGAGRAQVDVYGTVTRPDGTIVGEFTDSRRGNSLSEGGSITEAMERTINTISRMIYTGQYRRNAPESTSAAKQFKESMAATAATAPTQPATRSVSDRLHELDKLRQDGMVTEHEYEQRRAAILEAL